ncbi:transcription factor MYB44-like protein [Tanacetum coccineum]
MDQNLLEIKGAWSPEEDEMLQNILKKHGLRNWSLISKSIPGRSGQSCMSRWLSLDWLFTPEEDEMLQNLVEKHGPNWSLISTFIPSKSGESCRSRWLSHQVEHRPFMPEEGDTILRAHARFGNNCWGAISNLLSGRTYDEVEYYLNLTLKRKSSWMTKEDITIGAYSIYIPPPSFSDINRGKGNSNIHDGNLSHDVGGVSGHQAPSFSDIMGFNMSLGEYIL